MKTGRDASGNPYAEKLARLNAVPETRALVEAFVGEMTEGYIDGFRPDNPEPSSNRSSSYRHGFANGRDDRAHSPRALAQTLRIMADKALVEDVEAMMGRLGPVHSIDRPSSSTLH